ncbi:MAG: Cof-type HAD-IIB family hydrolase [Candidatus Cloacimonetes bacterium]|nr:Cof-type HAD-IIB family hydrolase [Candidatus Cloacimonadota bacterium]
MKEIHELSKTELNNIKLIIFDVDGVLVPRGTNIKQEGCITTLETKYVLTKQIDQISRLSELGYLINISSGRGLYMLQEVFRDILDFISITYENGSGTWYKGKIYQHFNSYDHLKDLFPILKKIKHPNIKGWEPKEFIITIHCKDRVPEIEEALSDKKDLYILWNGEAYDIGVKDLQTKGHGVLEIMKLFNLRKENIMAIGDNYNDKELLEQAGIKITADKTRLPGDFCVQIGGECLPAEALMEQIIKVKS